MLVITNAAAGGAEEQAVQAAVEVLRRASGAVEVAATGDVTELERVLAARNGRTVVVVGGDGSLPAVVGVLRARGWLADTSLGLVPLGTGNDFARGIGLPLDPAAAAEALLSAARDAQALKPRFGRLGYLIGALRAGFVSPGERLRVCVDGEVVADGRRRVLQVALANGRYVGGGIPITPDAVADDGLVDVVVSFAVSTPRRMAYALRAGLGQHPRRHDVRVRRGREVVVEGPALRWNVDGELVGPAPYRRWRVEPVAWTLLAPQAEPSWPSRAGRAELGRAELGRGELGRAELGRAELG